VLDGIVVQDGQLNIDFAQAQERPEINGIEILGAAPVQNQPPVADAGPDGTVTAGDTVAFDGSGSTDPDDEIVSYSWGFGDGATATGIAAAHCYTSPGDFMVTLTVTDNEGATGMDDCRVRVNVGPLNHLVVAPSTVDVEAGGSQQFTAQGYDGYGNEVDITLAWSSDVGSVDDSGLFTAQMMAGVSGYVKASMGAIEGQADVNIIGGTGEPRTEVLVEYGKSGNPRWGRGKWGGSESDKVSDYYVLLAPRWQSLPLDYTIDIGSFPVDPVAGAREIEAAFEAWDAATATELFAKPALSDQITVDFYDSNSTVSWRALNSYPEAVSVTALRYYDKDGDGAMSVGDQFIAFDVVLNLMRRWAIDPDGEGPLNPEGTWKWFRWKWFRQKWVDVRNIVTHEAGHVVGLADLYGDVYSELTMFGYAGRQETKKISLEAGDIAGVQAVYGP
jgi:PKD repeat protein